MPALAFERVALCCPSLLHQIFLSTSLELLLWNWGSGREEWMTSPATMSPSVVLLRLRSAMVTTFYFPAPWIARTLPNFWMPESILMKAQFSLMTPLSMCERKWLSTNHSRCFLCVQPLSCSLILGKYTDPKLPWFKRTMGWHSHIQF